MTELSPPAPPVSSPDKGHPQVQPVPHGSGVVPVTPLAGGNEGYGDDDSSLPGYATYGEGGTYLAPDLPEAGRPLRYSAETVKAAIGRAITRFVAPINKINAGLDRVQVTVAAEDEATDTPVLFGRDRESIFQTVPEGPAPTPLGPPSESSGRSWRPWGRRSADGSTPAPTPAAEVPTPAGAREARSNGPDPAETIHQQELRRARERYAEQVARRSSSTFAAPQVLRGAVGAVADRLQRRGLPGADRLGDFADTTSATKEGLRRGSDDYQRSVDAWLHRAVVAKLGGSDSYYYEQLEGDKAEVLRTEMLSAALEEMGALAEEVRKQRLIKAGVMDNAGNMIETQAVEGVRDQIKVWVAKGTRYWAELSEKGWKGKAAQFGIMAGAGLAIGAASAATVGIAGAAAGAAAIIPATRISRAVASARLTNNSKTMTRADQDRDNIINDISGLMTQNHVKTMADPRKGVRYLANVTAEQLRNEANKSSRGNRIRAAIGAVSTTLSIAGAEGGLEWLKDHAGGWFTATETGTPSAQGAPTTVSAPTSHEAATSTAAAPTTEAAAPTTTAAPIAPSSPQPPVGGYTPGEHTFTPQPPAAPDQAPIPGAPGAPANSIELHVDSDNETVSDVFANADGPFADNYNDMLSAAKLAQQDHLLRVVHRGSSFYYEVRNGNQWTSNTKDVVKVLANYTKGKYALAS